MKILSKIFSNTRKPEGFFGRMIVNGMNPERELYTYGLNIMQ